MKDSNKIKINVNKISMVDNMSHNNSRIQSGLNTPRISQSSRIISPSGNSTQRLFFRGHAK